VSLTPEKRISISFLGSQVRWLLLHVERQTGRVIQATNHHDATSLEPGRGARRHPNAPYLSHLPPSSPPSPALAFARGRPRFGCRYLDLRRNWRTAPNIFLASPSSPIWCDLLPLSPYYPAFTAWPLQRKWHPLAPSPCPLLQRGDW
jgi:hypothetical protein